MSTKIFVSYSHKDAALVDPVVRLLRINSTFVFRDSDNIRPGRKWQGEIDNGLAESDLVVLFWCAHSSESQEVSNEWRAALEQDKDLLPLLLDTTPLPKELSEFQWIDFRVIVGPEHAFTLPVAPPTLSRRAINPAWKWLVGVGATGFLFPLFLTLHSYWEPDSAGEALPAPPVAPPFPPGGPPVPEAP